MSGLEQRPLTKEEADAQWLRHWFSFNPPNELLLGVGTPDMTAADLGLEGPVWPVAARPR